MLRLLSPRRWAQCSQNDKTSLPLKMIRERTTKCEGYSELKKLKNTLADTKPVGELVKLERCVVCVCHLREDVSVYNHFNCCRWTREVRNAWTSDRSCAHGYSSRVRALTIWRLFSSLYSWDWTFYDMRNIWTTILRRVRLIRRSLG